MFASAKANLDIDADFGTKKLDQNLSISKQNYQTLFHKNSFSRIERITIIHKYNLYLYYCNSYKV